MTLRTRLLVVTVATLATGLGLLLLAGNVLYARTTDRAATNLLDTRLEAEIASLSLTVHGVRVRNTLNDDSLDTHGWIFSRGAAIERPAAISTALDAAATKLARSPRAQETDGPDGVELASRPLHAPGGELVGTVVVAASVTQFTHLRHVVLAGSLATALLILLVGALAVRRALNAALEPVAQMTASAEEWGAHDLERRFHLGTPRDEITGLAATLDHLLDRIAASRRHEQLFASEMAHELRTPLAAISGLAELACDNPRTGADADAEETLEQIQTHAQRMAKTIDALMAFARNETTDYTGTTDLSALMREFDGVTITAEPQLPPAEADPDIVRQALQPLLDNAHRHARSKVEITLTRSQIGGKLLVTVSDDGPGIDPALAATIFEPGVRGEATDGAGLGLPLSRRLARSCGGELQLLPGPGARFQLSLPARER